MIGVGVSEHIETHAAATSAAREALSGLEERKPSLAIAVSAHKHNGDHVLEAIRSVVGDVPVFGGSAMGVITRSTIGYLGNEVAVLALSEFVDPIHTITIRGLEEYGESVTGKKLGQQINRYLGDENVVILFYDTVRTTVPPRHNVGSILLDAVYETLANPGVHLIGAGMSGDLELRTGYVFTGNAAEKGCVTAIVLPPYISPSTSIMHACVPVSSFMEITRSEGSRIYELDNQPALPVLLEKFGLSVDQAENLILKTTLGQKYGDPFAPYDESAYVNQLIIDIDTQSGAIGLFEADLKIGARIQLMARDNNLMIESVRQRTREILANQSSRNPFLAFYIDCGGRTCLISGAEKEEARLLEQELPAKLPLFGFYSAVEIAPFYDRSRPLNWTGVLTLLADISNE